MSSVSKQWRSVCTVNDLVNNSGVCLLINEDTPEEQQVALFTIGENKLFAVDNYCPFGKANVLYRGLLGTLGGRYVVASPLYKQHFDLENGECLEDESVTLSTFEVRLKEQTVEMYC